MEGTITEQEVISIVADALGVSETSLTVDTQSKDVLEWDSLGHLSILSTLDSTLGDRYKESPELASAVSIKDLVTSLNK